MAQLKLLFDNIAIRKHAKEAATASGILTGETGTQDQGEVIAVGPGKLNKKGELIPTQVKVGETVVFGKYSGNTVQYCGETLCLMHESEILAVLDD